MRVVFEFMLFEAGAFFGFFVAALLNAAHRLLQGFQVIIDLDLLRILSRCNFQHRQSVLVLFHYLPPQI